MQSNKSPRSHPFIRQRHLAAFAIFAVVLLIVGGMFSTSASKSEKGRAQCGFGIESHFILKTERRASERVAVGNSR